MESAPLETHLHDTGQRGGVPEDSVSRQEAPAVLDGSALHCQKEDCFLADNVTVHKSLVSSEITDTSLYEQLNVSDCELECRPVVLVRSSTEDEWPTCTSITGKVAADVKGNSEINAEDVIDKVSHALDQVGLNCQDSNVDPKVPFTIDQSESLSPDVELHTISFNVIAHVDGNGIQHNVEMTSDMSVDLQLDIPKGSSKSSTSSSMTNLLENSAEESTLNGKCAPGHFHDCRRTELSASSSPSSHFVPPATVILHDLSKTVPNNSNDGSFLKSHDGQEFNSNTLEEVAILDEPTVQQCLEYVSSCGLVGNVNPIVDAFSLHCLGAHAVKEELEDSTKSTLSCTHDSSVICAPTSLLFEENAICSRECPEEMCYKQGSGHGLFKNFTSTSEQVMPPHCRKMDSSNEDSLTVCFDECGSPKPCYSGQKTSFVGDAPYSSSQFVDKPLKYEVNKCLLEENVPQPLANYYEESVFTPSNLNLPSTVSLLRDSSPLGTGFQKANSSVLPQNVGKPSGEGCYELSVVDAESERNICCKDESSSTATCIGHVTASMPTNFKMKLENEGNGKSNDLTSLHANSDFDVNLEERNEGNRCNACQDSKVGCPPLCEELINSPGSKCVIKCKHPATCFQCLCLHSSGSTKRSRIQGTSLETIEHNSSFCERSCNAVFPSTKDCGLVKIEDVQNLAIDLVDNVLNIAVVKVESLMKKNECLKSKAEACEVASTLVNNILKLAVLEANRSRKPYLLEKTCGNMKLSSEDQVNHRYFTSNELKTDSVSGSGKRLSAEITSISCCVNEEVVLENLCDSGSPLNDQTYAMKGSETESMKEEKPCLESKSCCATGNMAVEISSNVLPFFKNETVEDISSIRVSDPKEHDLKEDESMSVSLDCTFATNPKESYRCSLYVEKDSDLHKEANLIVKSIIEMAVNCSERRNSGIDSIQDIKEENNLRTSSTERESALFQSKSTDLTEGRGSSQSLEENMIDQHKADLTVESATEMPLKLLEDGFSILDMNTVGLTSPGEIMSTSPECVTATLSPDSIRNSSHVEQDLLVHREASVFVDGLIDMAVSCFASKSIKSDGIPAKDKKPVFDADFASLEEEELVTPCGDMLTEHFMDFESGRNVSVFCPEDNSMSSHEHILSPYDQVVYTIGNREVDSDTGKSVSVFRSGEDALYEIQRASTCTSVFESVEEEDEHMIESSGYRLEGFLANNTFLEKDGITNGLNNQPEKDCDAFEDAVDAFLEKERLVRDDSNNAACMAQGLELESISNNFGTFYGNELRKRRRTDDENFENLAAKPVLSRQAESDLSNMEQKRLMAERWANGVPDTSEMHEKQKAIREALDSGSNVASKLCKLALTEGGLINDALRREAWPRMLGLDPTLEISAPSLEDLKSHPEYEQVVLDVNRSLKRFPPDIPHELWESLQSKLTHLIMFVICKYPHLRYYQGYHDVAVTFLLVVGESVALQIMERLSTEHLSDCMQPTMERTSYLLHFIYPLLHRLHPTLAEYLERSEVGTMFCLPWFLTWFGHSLNRYQDVVRLYDHFLASPPLAPLYLAAVLVAHRAEEVLAVDCDMAAIHALLSHIPDTLPLEILLRDATDLYERYPPESIEKEVDERFHNEQEMRLHEMASRERVRRQRALDHRPDSNRGRGSWQLVELGPAMTVLNRWMPPWVVQQQRLSMRLLFASATFVVGFYVYARGGDVFPYP